VWDGRGDPYDKAASEPGRRFWLPRSRMELDDLAHECQTIPSRESFPQSQRPERVNGSKIYGKRSLRCPAIIYNTQNA